MMPEYLWAKMKKTAVAFCDIRIFAQSTPNQTKNRYEENYGENTRHYYGTPLDLHERAMRETCRFISWRGLGYRQTPPRRKDKTYRPGYGRAMGSGFGEMRMECEVDKYGKNGSGGREVEVEMMFRSYLNEKGAFYAPFFTIRMILVAIHSLQSGRYNKNNLCETNKKCVYLSNIHMKNKIIKKSNIPLLHIISCLVLAIILLFIVFFAFLKNQYISLNILAIIVLIILLILAPFTEKIKIKWTGLEVIKSEESRKISK